MQLEDEGEMKSHLHLKQGLVQRAGHQFETAVERESDTGKTQFVGVAILIPWGGRGGGGGGGGGI